MRLIRYAALIMAFAAPASAQSGDEASTLLPHGEGPLWISGQINVIAQRHGAFPAKYDGDQSFRSTDEHAVSRILTLYTGVKLPGSFEITVDIEAAGGHGLSEAFGLAGFTDLDVVRNPSLGTAPYLARLMVRKIIRLSDDDVDSTPTPLALASRVPARRLEIRAGKLGIVDFFDVNAVGSDSHLQFTNWTIDNNGAYDYAADTRGYTNAVIVEYDEPRYSVRAAEALMPTVANGIDLDWHVSRSRGENLEVEIRPAATTTVRALAYANHANMGSYEEAIAAFVAGTDAVPNITAHRRQGRVKYGFGGSVDHATAIGVRVFARGGWNEGANESFAYTEVNNTASAGADVTGARWNRRNDRVGLAFASNGLSPLHREYLRLGGDGFLLGDGTLRYGREDIVEGYYNARIWRGVFAAAGFHFIVHPGYNQDRGPVLVESARLHLEF
jgi:high affinity Mn2+ porin